MWIPKCCNADFSNVDPYMRNQVALYYKKLDTKTQDGKQSNVYSPNLILKKRCYVKDNSLSAQDTAINSGIRDPENSKELIFKYFDITAYKFNEIDWAGSRFQVLSSSKKASITLDGKRFNASDNQPFISILAGLKKL